MVANSSEADLIRQGIELFNCGEFFECHEVLEQVWLNAQDERKLFLQGLIQIAVGFYHLRRGNAVGATRLLNAGSSKLRLHGASQSWVDTVALATAVEPVVHALQTGSAESDATLPKIRVLPQFASESL
jgi:uncharacterized protein